jgi:hypothetical protein
MAETSTLQRASNLRIEGELASLLEGKDGPHNIEHIGWRNSTPHVLLESLGSQSVPYPTSHRNVFLSHHGTDEPPFAMSMTPASIGPVGNLRRHITNARGSIGRRPVGGSDYGLVWRYSHDPNLQGRVLGAFALRTDEESSVPANILTDVERAIVREWSALVHDLTEWQEEATDSRGQERLAARLRASFEVEPVEDGMGHPAEEIIGEALRSSEAAKVLDSLRYFCTDAAQPSFAASALRCLGRHDYVGTSSWRVGLVRDSLAMDSVEIRDAAVQAAELWGDTDSIEVLRSHTEPEPWLKQYVFDVVDDLAE